MGSQNQTTESAVRGGQRLPIPPKQRIVKAIETNGMYRVVPVNPPKPIIPTQASNFFEALHKKSDKKS